MSLADSSTMLEWQIILRSCGFCAPRSLPTPGKASSRRHHGSFQQLWGDVLHLLPIYIPRRDQTQRA